MEKQYVYILAVDVERFDKRLSEKFNNPRVRKSMMDLDHLYFDSLGIPSPFPFEGGFDTPAQKGEFVKRHNVQIKTENGIPVYDGEKLADILVSDLNISRTVALEYIAIRKQYFNDNGLMGNVNSRFEQP